MSVEGVESATMEALLTEASRGTEAVLGILRGGREGDQRDRARGRSLAWR